MKCFIGEVHSHTTESDGKGGSPREAYEYARDVGKVDYFAVTDHNTQLIQERFSALMPPLADEMNEDGRFAALYGYEMSYGAQSGYYGHLNVYGAKNVDDDSHTLKEWYGLLGQRGEAELGEFNHPGEKWGDFEEFAYNKEMDEIFNIIELRIEEYGVPVIEEEYERCLAAGWHVGPVSNEDTHGANWTTIREETGVVLAESLSRENILAAMKARRTYATTDESLKIFYQANSQWMGSVLRKTGRLKIRVEISTEKSCGIGILQAVGEQNTVLAQIDVGERKSFVWETDIEDSHKYVYIRRIKGTHYAVTAPVWIDEPAGISLKAEYGFDEKGIRIEARLENALDIPAKSVKVSFISENGRIIPEVSRSISAEIAEILPRSSDGVSCFASLWAEEYKITVAVDYILGGLPMRTAQTLYVCPLTVTRFFANTARYSADRYYSQPFCCFDIHNGSQTPCNLSDYVFRMYLGAGLMYENFSFDKMLEGGETVTVWFKGDRNLDADDFNQAFGTSLTEGENLLIAPATLDSRLVTRKLLICRGNTTVRRAWIRYGDYKNTPIPVGAAIKYSHDENRATGDICKIATGELPGACTPLKKISDSAFTSRVAFDKFAKIEKKPFGKVACVCDGCMDEQSLDTLVRRQLGDIEQLELLIGGNSGEQRLDAYIRTAEGEALLLRAADSDADTVVLCLGGCDVDKKRTAWLGNNFLSLATLLECITLYMKTMGKNVYILEPWISNDSVGDVNALRRAIYSVSGTLSVPCSVKENPYLVNIPAPQIVKALPPCDNALRIACVGDGQTEGMGGITPYPQRLIALLGRAVDVRVFAKEGAQAAEPSPFYLLSYASEELEVLKSFKPQAVVLWLSMADIKIKHCKDWDNGFKEKFICGFERIVKQMIGTGARLYLVSPFCRQDNDIRRQITAREGDGVGDTVKAVAKRMGVPVIDLTDATRESGEYVKVGRKNYQYLSEAGNEYLARRVLELIDKDFNI